MFGCIQREVFLVKKEGQNKNCCDQTIFIACKYVFYIQLDLTSLTYI